MPVGHAELDPPGQVDLFTSAAPVLAAVPVALLIMRAYPAGLRWLTKLSRRRRGVVLVVGFARGRAAAQASLLPAFALVLAFTVIAFLQNWNNFLFPLVVTSSEHLMMISQGLTEFQGQITGVAYNLLMAGSLIAVIPVLIVAMVAQRKVVEGLTIGALR